MKLSDITERIGSFVRSYPAITGAMVIVFAVGLGYFYYVTNFRTQLSKSSAAVTLSAGTSSNCVPVTETNPAPGWTSENWLEPVSAGQALPWCTPFPGTPGVTDGVYTFPDCFLWDLSGASGAYNWQGLSARDNPLNVVTQALPQTVLRNNGSTFNNCPWTVHLIAGALGSPKSYNGSNEKDADQDVDRAFTVEPESRDFPSCWNNSPQPNCLANTSPPKFKDEFKLTTYNCGFITAGAGWRHYVNGGGQGSQDYGGWNSIFTYGRDCNSADVAAGKSPGSAGSGSSGVPGVCPSPAAAPLPATLTVACGATQNVLSWQAPSSLRANENVVRRITNGTTGQVIFDEAGCYGTFVQRTFTDTQISPGNTYTYYVKTGPNTISNYAVCPQGSSPSISPGISPTPSVPPVITPPATGTQLQCGPTSQTVVVNQEGTVQAFGGSGMYAFAVSENGMMRQISATQIGVTYSTAGTKTVMLADGRSTAQCQIVVTANGGVPTPTPTVVIGTGTGTETGVGGVQTGPGETVLTALLVSTIISLLYVSYAHSPLGRRHEAEVLAKDQSPADFKK